MISIEFTEEEAASMAWGYVYPAEIRDKFIDALPEPCTHTCPCTSDDECPHDCPCEETP